MTTPTDTAAPDGTAPIPVAVGDIVGDKYRVDRLIGMGGMAAVIAGTHVELDQPIAVKLLLPERASQPDAVRRFLTEARAAAKLKSAHVARIADVGTTRTKGGQILPFIVMELLEGSDFASVLMQRGALSPDEAVAYILQACDAVAEAHALGIVHRDIKPANLFLTQSRGGAPIVKLLDFGISKTSTMADSSPSSLRSNLADRALTADNETMGSPGYMSPEQIRSPKEVDHRTDVWSLGVVLYELLTGADAFAGANATEVFRTILETKSRPVQALAPHVPPELCAIVERCLEKDRTRRFQSVGELAAALSAVAPSGASVAVPAAPSSRKLPLPATVIVRRDTARSGRAPVIVLAAALVGLVLVGAALAASRSRPAVAANAATAPTPTTTAPTTTMTTSTITSTESPEPPAAESTTEPDPSVEDAPTPAGTAATRHPHPNRRPRVKGASSALPRHRTEW